MSIKEISCDCVVIGAGTAGLEAYREAAAAGRCCILVDAGPLGTSAQRSGEIPASYLMSAGLSMHALSALDKCGILANFSGFDTSGVLNVIRVERSRATSDVLTFLYRIPEERRLRGRACFEDPYTLKAGEEFRVHFKTAVIATGSEPLVTYEQSRLRGILTTNEFYDQETLPESAAVFGSSATGLQLGQALSYLGVNVVVFGQRKLWELSDEAVLALALEMFSDRFNLAIDSFITAIDTEEEGYSIYYIDDGRFENYLHMQKVIAATDRIPNVGGLNLVAVGVKQAATGRIIVDEGTMQTSVPHIFAAGGVCCEKESSVVSRTQGRCAGRNAASFPQLHQMPPLVNISVAYTDPQLAIVGCSLENMKSRALDTGSNFVVSQSRFGDIISDGRHHSGGIVSMYTDERTHRVMGAEICAHDAAHLAQLLALAISLKSRAEDLQEFNFLRLSGEEHLRRAAASACTALSGLGRVSGLI